MQPGSCADAPVLDVVSAFQSYGRYLDMGSTPEAEAIRLDTVRNSCRKEGGSCGGMYTAKCVDSSSISTLQRIDDDAFVQHYGVCC